MPEIVYLNGKHVSTEEAVVSVNDRGFLFGDGVYEVLRGYGGRLWALERHLSRLERSLGEIDMGYVDVQESGRMIREAYVASGIPDALVYVQITRGVAPRSHAYARDLRPTILITVRDVGTSIGAVDPEGVSAITAHDLRWRRCDIKSTSLLPNVLAATRARDAGAYETILIHPDGYVTEGSKTSVFWVIGGTVCTSPPGPEVLPSITREILVEILHEGAFAYREERCPLEVFRRADEIFIAGTTTEVCSVTALDGAPVGSGRVGPITAQLRAAFRGRIEEANDTPGPCPGPPVAEPRHCGSLRPDQCGNQPSAAVPEASKRRREGPMSDRIRVIQVGLGALGRRVTRLLVQRRDLVVVGAVDPDPQLVGARLAEIADLDLDLDVTITPEPAAALSGTRADVVVHTTVSSLAIASDQIMSLLDHGLHVVSSCEELSYPWLTAPDTSRAIDRKAKAAGKCVLATGVNPGFLMDFLPLVLTAICGRVDKITVRRYQDARFRRLPFQRKIGAGLTPEEFEEKKRSGALRHVGLTESLHMIAHRLGWRLERVTEEIEPVIAEAVVASADITVSPGMAAGVSQTAVGFAGGRERIRLEFRACLGEPDVQDTVTLQGDQPCCFSVPGGVNGDAATCAVLVNAIRTAVAASPGLHTMVDLPVITCSAG